MPANRVAALVLAAGASARMGRPKQLLDWDGRPLVRVAAEVALAAKLDPLLVVVGGAQAQVAEALAGLPLRIIANPAYAAGQSTSLRAGIAALGQDADAVVVLLGDQPFVTAAIVEQLVAAWHTSGALIVAPTYAGQRGNPLPFSLSCWLCRATRARARCWPLIVRASAWWPSTTRAYWPTLTRPRITNGCVRAGDKMTR